MVSADSIHAPKHIGLEIANLTAWKALGSPAAQVLARRLGVPVWTDKTWKA